MQKLVCKYKGKKSKYKSHSQVKAIQTIGNNRVNVICIISSNNQIPLYVLHQENTLRRSNQNESMLLYF